MVHELIDVRYAMADAIAELRGEMATKGTYSGDLLTAGSAPQKAVSPPPAPAGMQFHRDFVYGLGSAPCPKRSSTDEQREQLRRLAPRADLKRMIERLRAEVDETTLPEVESRACLQTPRAPARAYRFPFKV